MIRFHRRARCRRGSQAVEFALSVPFFMVLVSSVVDLRNFLNVNDALVAAVASGVRSGALVEAHSGQDPMVVARRTAQTSWVVSGVGDTLLTLQTEYIGQSPDRLLVMTGSVPYEPAFGFLPLPPVVEYSGALLTVIQP